MVSFTYRMPAGIPGDVNRAWTNIIEPQVITPFGTTGAPSAYGVPLVVDATSGLMRTLTVGDTTVYGFLVRAYPTQDYSSINAPLGTSMPPPNGTCDVMVSGYMSILLNGATVATKGGAVYVWTAVSSGAHIQGGLEAANPGGSGFVIPNAYFMGPADSNGNTEIAFRV